MSDDEAYEEAKQENYHLSYYYPRGCTCSLCTEVRERRGEEQS
jgi:hypothetical protein